MGAGGKSQSCVLPGEAGVRGGLGPCEFPGGVWRGGEEYLMWWMDSGRVIRTAKLKIRDYR